MILGINLNRVRIVFDRLVVLFVSESLVSQSVANCNNNQKFGVRKVSNRFWLLHTRYIYILFQVVSALKIDHGEGVEAFNTKETKSITCYRVVVSSQSSPHCELRDGMPVGICTDLLKYSVVRHYRTGSFHCRIQ
jgi:hypothetical protein